jgi:hypothetical protein
MGMATITNRPELDEELRTMAGKAMRALELEPDVELDCRRCGHELDEDGFCAACGATLTQSQPEPR